MIRLQAKNKQCKEKTNTTIALYRYTQNRQVYTDCTCHQSLSECRAKP
jgi:hypothetical protein